MTDQRAFRLIPGGAASAPPDTRRVRRAGRAGPREHLRLVAQEAADRDAEAPLCPPPAPLRPLRRPTDVALRLAIWAEAARAAGDVDRADRLCLMAWDAYDRPVRDSVGTDARRS